MSYILDALRKADAQRSRDPVRGIHAQPLRNSPGPGNRAGFKPWMIAVGVAVIAAIAGGAWYAFHDRAAVQLAQAPIVVVQTAPSRGMNASMAPPMSASPATPTAPVVGTAIQPPPPMASTAPVTPPPFVPQLGQPQFGQPPGGDPRNTSRPTPRGMPATTQPPVIGATATPPQLPSATVAAPMPSLVPSAPSMGPSVTAQPPSATSPVLVPPANTVAPLPTSQAAPPVVTPPVAGLPPGAPPMAITGGVYSTNRVQRMLIVNGQVFNEGSEVAAGVVLEEIKPKTAVLRFRGAKYSVTY